MNDQLDELIRHAFDDIVSATPELGPTPTSSTDAHTVVDRRRWTVIAAAAVIVTIGVGGIAMLDRPGSNESPATSPNAATPTDDPTPAGTAPTGPDAAGTRTDATVPAPESVVDPADVDEWETAISEATGWDLVNAEYGATQGSFEFSDGATHVWIETGPPEWRDVVVNPDVAAVPIPEGSLSVVEATATGLARVLIVVAPDNVVTADYSPANSDVDVVIEAARRIARASIALRNHSTDEPLWLLPSELDGYVLDLADNQLRGVAHGRTVAIFVRATGDGTYSDKVSVQRAPRENVWIDAAAQDNELSYDVTTEQVGERTVEVLYDATNQTLTAQLDLGDDTIIQLLDDSPGDLAAARSDLLSLAGAVDPSGAGGLDIGSVPSGYELGFVGDPGETVGPSSFMSYRHSSDPDPRGTLLWISVAATTDPAWAFHQMADTLEPAEVRGHGGYATTHTYPASTGMVPTTSLIWRETPSHWVSVTGDGLAVDELRDIADGLRFVPEDEWHAVAATAAEPSEQ